MDDLVARDRCGTVAAECRERGALAGTDATGDRDSDRAAHVSRRSVLRRKRPDGLFGELLGDGLFDHGLLEQLLRNASATTASSASSTATASASIASSASSTAISSASIASAASSAAASLSPAASASSASAASSSATASATTASVASSPASSSAISASSASSIATSSVATASATARPHRRRAQRGVVDLVAPAADVVAVEAGNASSDSRRFGVRWTDSAPSARGSGSAPSSTRLSESDRRRRSPSTSRIRTLTGSPCETTSRGFST